MNMKLTD